MNVLLVTHKPLINKQKEVRYYGRITQKSIRIRSFSKLVKSKIREMLFNFDGRVNKPYGKFILEIVTGILITGSCNVTEISRSLKEKIKLKDTMKRLFNNLGKDVDLLSLSNDYLLSKASGMVTDTTIIALDEGDITHLYSNNFELSCKVRDGSTGRILDGYHLNQISCYNPSNNLTYPAYFEIFSSNGKEFKSSNTEGLKAVDVFIDKVGKKGLWVLDRGYDSGIFLEKFLSEGLNFVIRMKSNRHLFYNGKALNIEKLSKSINKRYKIGKSYRFGYLKCELLLNNIKHPVTLIRAKGVKNKNDILFLTNGWLKKSSEVKRRINGYFKRWSVEECYRFEKQGFGIEDSTLRRFPRIRSMLGAVMLAWSVLVDINLDELLKAEVIQESKPEKRKKVSFIYYLKFRTLKTINFE